MERGEQLGWVDTVIWWHVYPLGFVGADTRGNDLGQPVAHRLPQVSAWLDDLVDLGANGLLLGPVFASQTHGYDTVDHLRIDPRLGDDHDVDALIAACRERGIRVLFDGVFNHVGRDHPWWRQAIADGPGSAAAQRFAAGDREVDGLKVSVFEGHDALVVLNHEHPEVIDYVRQLMEHWLARGIDGWRLDAAYAVDPAFWRAVLEPVRGRFPDAWFVGEVIHGDYPSYVDESGLDSVTQYELWKAVRSSIQERNLFELDWSLQRHRGFVERFLPMTFLGNHDVTRIASAIDDERNHPHAIALLFFLPGVPSVYAGDERGMRAIKEERAGGDDAVRPQFPADPAAWPPDATFRAHQEAIAFRRRNPWLASARVDAHTLSNHTMLVRAAGPAGETATLALNLSDQVQVIDGIEVAPHGFARAGGS